jgi:hypothetical protein
MKNLRKFGSEAAYLAAKDSLTLPNVSKVEGGAVHYDREHNFVPLFLFSDFSQSAELISGKTPIAVMVAPADHFIDGKARWMSLRNMSIATPNTGTVATGNVLYDAEENANPGAGIIWGNPGTIYNKTLAGTPNLDLQQLVAGNYKVSSGLFYDDAVNKVGGWARFPSDQFKAGRRASVWPEDGVIGTSSGKVYYPRDKRYGIFLDTNNTLEANHTAPGLFDRDGALNPDIRVGQVFTDLDGAANTDALMALEAVADWATSETMDNTAQANHFPAACLTRRYRTAGTNAGDWYLPAIGELAYVGTHIWAINQQIKKITDEDAAAERTGEDVRAVGVGDYSSSGTLGNDLWSSSEYSAAYAWYLSTGGCLVVCTSKSSMSANFRVRAFLKY